MEYMEKFGYQEEPGTATEIIAVTSTLLSDDLKEEDDKVNMRNNLNSGNKYAGDSEDEVIRSLSENPVNSPSPSTIQANSPTPL